MTLLLLACLPACEGEPPPTAFPITFAARADEPLGGVEVSVEGGQRLGATGPDGTLRVTLAGREGTTVPFRVKCPAGHRAPREMPALTLRRFIGLDPASAARGIRVSIECRPARRMAALVVRAGQPGLPVLARGREVARTGPDGVAHALVTAPPGTTFRVVLDTTGWPRLRPQSPATTLAIADTDEVFLIDQGFAQSFDESVAPGRAVEEPARPAPPPRRRRYRAVKKPDERPPAPPPPPPRTVPERLN
jgi:hypothetical protein